MRSVLRRLAEALAALSDQGVPEEAASQQPTARFFGIRPDAIATLEEAELERAREEIRNSRWARHERQLRWLLPAGLVPTLLALVQLDRLLS